MNKKGNKLEIAEKGMASSPLRVRKRIEYKKLEIFRFKRDSSDETGDLNIEISQILRI